MEKRFKLKEHGTTVRTEVMAGITTFMAMAYILMVNAGMFADPWHRELRRDLHRNRHLRRHRNGSDRSSREPPSGAGLRHGSERIFCLHVCFTFGLSYANGLVLVLVDGIVFVLLTVTGLRKMILTPSRQPSRTAISARYRPVHRLHRPEGRRASSQMTRPRSSLWAPLEILSSFSP